jgi:hypothetical protein
MSALTGFFAFLKLLPELIEGFKKLGELLEQGSHALEVKISLKKFDQAAAKAEKEKDTSELENLFNPKPPQPKP